MDQNEENLIDPVAYTPDVDEYYNWLKEICSYIWFKNSLLLYLI